MAWGYHLILDCKSGDLNSVKSYNNIKSYINDLLKNINMKAYGNPIIEHFAEHNKYVAGYTFVQLIETSAITGHFSDFNGDFYIDIFSCAYFDMEKAINVTKEYFSPESIKDMFLVRDARYDREQI